MERNMTRRNTRFALLTSVAAVAFDGPGWKMDNGNIVLKDGNPVYINAEGAEMTMGADTIGRLNHEAAGHRKEAQKAQDQLKKFEGIDPDIARKAIETAGKLDAKQLIDAGEVDKVKEQISGEYKQQLLEKDNALTKAQETINNMSIDSVFSTSEFVRDQIAVPQDMFQAAFKSNFKRNENGEIEAYGRDGNRLMSKERIGEYAKPDEALRLLVETHPAKDTILKAPPAGGSGSQGQGGNRGQGNTIKRSDFSAMSPAEKAATGAKAAAGEVTIVD